VRARVVVLGAGFGGLEVATRLSEAFGDDADVAVIDQRESFVFGFSKLEVMFGRMTPAHALHPYADINQPGVRFVRAAIRSIDPVAMTVTTDRGQLDADMLVVALGADLHPAATPGLGESGHEFYTVAGAFELRDVLASFQGGRVIVGVTSAPFKCPPAPSETALLMHDYLTARGLRAGSEISLVMPFAAPIPPSPAASAALLEAFDERGIAWQPGKLIRELEPSRKVAITSDGTELPFDLFLGVPVHSAPAVVVDAGLTVDGWIPVNPRTLETRFPDVYAVGDVTSVGTPKAGVFAEGQAAVVASEIIGRIEGAPVDGQYDGHGLCYLEFGRDMVAKVDVTFLSGEKPSGALEGPSAALSADKDVFGSSRIQRWFGRTWHSDVEVAAGSDL